MIEFVTCLTVNHDPVYVLMSFAVCAIGAVLTFTLFKRALGGIGRRRAPLALIAGMIGGCTVWTTHFVSMLGMTRHVDLSYDPMLTLASLVAAMVFCGAGFLAASGDVKGSRVFGGLVIGTGIALMHYTGLAAVSTIGSKAYDQVMVLLSVAAGVSFSVCSISSFRATGGIKASSAAVALFVLAVGALHYLGMSSLTVDPVAVSTSGAANDGTEAVLVTGVLFVTGMMMLLGIAAYALDSEASREKYEEMRLRANVDPVTGLDNRRAFEEQMEAKLAGRPEGHKLAVASFKVANFAAVGDVHSRKAADAVATEAARCASAALRRGERLFRIDGGEFVAYSDAVTDRPESLAFAERLRSAAQTTVIWEDAAIPLSVHAGVALWPFDGDNTDALSTSAVLAMRRARREGARAAVAYVSALDEEDRDRSALAQDLPAALRENQFELRYQRQTRVADGGLIGYEVLLRWNHPTRGMISPAVFIPIAERSGLICDIGAWVMQAACAEAASWAVPLRIAVNVAARQLADLALPSIVRNALKASGLCPSRLEIEITESGIIEDAARARSIVMELKALGVSIAMDDFGTGYSSLSTLQTFPFDKIKVDRAFVGGIAGNRQSRAIMASTLQLGRSLDMAVLAEGVESDEDLEYLRKAGCQQVQGFLFGEPITAAEIRARHRKAE